MSADTVWPGGGRETGRHRSPGIRAASEGRAMTDVTQRIECQWCHSQSRADARSCETCGAPLDIKNLVSDSGWREAPRLRDMTEIHFGDSVCQVEGEVVPVADMNLAAGDAVFFEHHVLLWNDESVGLSVMSTPGEAK